ncbi:glycosyltransferase family 2 protein [Bremerella sp. JC817]|uniref:glycosyltransferase family 2 protein n=1 Tax=Bremerella sp. JC817 TaxID=3231756 RepID=UPI00345AF99E
MNGPRLHTSVALCTYNGERYLPIQLESIAQQTIVPDELIICDDGSTDATADIVADFQREAPFAVRWIRNPRNLGSTANFEQAMQACSHPVIFLCDQDDRWRQDKVERMLEALNQHPDAGFAFSNARIVDEAGDPRGFRAWDSLPRLLPGGKQVAAIDLYPHLLKQCMVTGAAMAVRRDYLKAVCPIPRDWVHDAWMAIVLSAWMPSVAIDDDLIDYRVHARQQIGLRRPSRFPLSLGPLGRSLRSKGIAGTKSGEIERLQKMARQFAQVKQHLQTLDAPELEDVLTERLADLDEAADHFRTRLQIKATGRQVAKVFGELRAGRYHRFSLGYLTAVRDLAGF